MKEPTFPHLDHIRGNMECDQARAWMEWAKLTLQELSNEVAEARKSRQEAVSALQTKENEIQRLKEGIEGLKNWVNASKPNLEVYEPGAKIMLSVEVGGEREVTVDVVYLEQGTIKYGVYWWSSGIRHRATISLQEIVRGSDVLPLPNRQGIAYK